MSRPGTQSSLSPESFLDDVLHSRPPVPVGRPDISELAAEAELRGASQAGWAWDKVPAWLAEVESTYNRTGDRPIVVLDLCSSLPLYAQRLRTLEFDRDAVRARGLIKETLGVESLAELRRHSPELAQVGRVLSAQAQPKRRLEAALQESLYEITPTEAVGTSATNPRYAHRLLGKLLVHRHSYTHNHELEGIETDRGPRVERREDNFTYLELLANLEIPSRDDEVIAAQQRLAEGTAQPEDIEIAPRKQPVGNELAARFLDWHIDELAHIVVGSSRYRPARFISMDAAEPRDIAISALAKMPGVMRELDIFNQAAMSLFDPIQHLTSSIFKPLPFPDNSLTLISGFDGWPFHFQTDSAAHPKGTDFGQVTSEVLHELYGKLMHGGKLFIFPWAIHDKDYGTVKGGSRTLMEVAAAFGGAVNEQFSFRGVHRTTLGKYMSPTDRETSDRMSPILSSPSDYFLALVIDKSRQSTLQALQARG